MLMKIVLYYLNFVPRNSNTRIMKALLNYPFAIYLIAALTCLGIMIIVDYVLGAEAEHLNAWVIINKLFGNDVGVADSLAIKKFGLFGATAVMLLLNTIFGFILVQIIKLIVRTVHS